MTIAVDLGRKAAKQTKFTLLSLITPAAALSTCSPLLFLLFVFSIVLPCSPLLFFLLLPLLLLCLLVLFYSSFSYCPCCYSVFLLPLIFFFLLSLLLLCLLVPFVLYPITPAAALSSCSLFLYSSFSDYPCCCSVFLFLVLYSSFSN